MFAWLGFFKHSTERKVKAVIEVSQSGYEKCTVKNHIRLLNCPALIKRFFFVMLPSHTQFPVFSAPLLVFFEKSGYVLHFYGT